MSITWRDFIRLTPTEEEVAQALREDAAEPDYRDSARNNKRRWVGRLAEIMVSRYLLNAERENSPHFDIRLRDGRVADVKSKRKACVPRESHDASVPSDRGIALDQHCDLYIFVFIECMHSTKDADYIDEPSTPAEAGVLYAWLVGWMEKGVFLLLRKFTAKGTVQEGYGVAQENQWDVRVDMLEPMRLLLEIQRNHPRLPPVPDAPHAPSGITWPERKDLE